MTIVISIAVFCMVAATFVLFARLVLEEDRRHRQAMAGYDRRLAESRAQRHRVHSEQYAKERAAMERAESLLRSHLSPKQLKDYDNTGAFTVYGSEGGRYRIRTGVVANVQAYRAMYSAYAPNVPTHDSMLMQKLVIENDEDRFLERAIKT